MSLHFTSSWDDGSVHDLRLARLLDKYDIEGTFYLPQLFDGRHTKFRSYKRTVTKKEIKEISLVAKIGSHTLTHRVITGLSDSEAKTEIAGSKRYLEDIIGPPIDSIAFPLGKFGQREIRFSQAAGFKSIRTTKKLNIFLPKDPYNTGVTVQFAPFPLRRLDASHYYWRNLLDPVKSYGLKLLNYFPRIFSWRMFAWAVFRKAYNSGNYFHLYGHSWEIEKYQLWDELEKFLKSVKPFLKT